MRAAIFREIPDIPTIPRYTQDVTRLVWYPPSFMILVLFIISGFNTRRYTPSNLLVKHETGPTVKIVYQNKLNYFVQAWTYIYTVAQKIGPPI